MAPMSLALSFALSFATTVLGQYTATYSPDNGLLPVKSLEGQTGTNRCGTGSSQDSVCQNVFINSVQDFCLWGPPYSDGVNATIGNVERELVSWCTKSGYGTRLIPDGTILGAHFIDTPEYVQITGEGDFTKIGIPKGDYGGELDPHGADGFGNPIGGLVFGNSYGPMQQYHEWTTFMSDTTFCFRACKPGPNARKLCQHIYDTLGCLWNLPADYSLTFNTCKADVAQPMGLYDVVVNGQTVTSTFHQGQTPTPLAHPAPSSSECVVVPSITQVLGAAVTGVNVSITPRPSTRSTVRPRSTAARASSTGAGAGAGADTGAAMRAGASWQLSFGVLAALGGGMFGAFVAL